jgi:RNA polymerase sigma-70 factor (ECF subfamily)
VSFIYAFEAASGNSTFGRESAQDLFAAKVEKELPGLRRYATALLRGGSDADDLVQETVLRALDRMALFQPGTNLRAWLFTIMHNLRINAARRTRREATGLSDEAAALLAVPERQGGAIALRDLRRALEELDEAHRSVLLLVGLEGLSYEEVADVLNLPMGTVRSRLSRARTRLRHLLDA